MFVYEDDHLLILQNVHIRTIPIIILIIKWNKTIINDILNIYSCIDFYNQMLKDFYVEFKNQDKCEIILF